MGVIYAIRVTGSDRVYIGSARDLKNRMKGHLSNLRLGKHHALKLRLAVRKFGIEALSVEVIEAVPNDADLLVREQVWIDKFKGRLFNTSPTAQSRLGAKMPMSARLAISQSLIGNKHRLGIPHDAEARAKIGAAVRRSYAEGRHRVSSGNVDYFAAFQAAVRSGDRAHPKAVSDSRARAILTMLYETKSLDATAARFSICKGSVWYIAKQVREKLDDYIECATGLRHRAKKRRSTHIHPEWLDMVLEGANECAMQ